MKDKKQSYFGEIKETAKSLLTGMGVTWKEYFTPKITEQYPENRKTVHIAERHRGTLIMPHDEEGKNKCVACLMCESACPNGTIRIKWESVVTADGKKKRLLKDYVYDLGDCMFCQLCVNACNFDAIHFSNSFEHSVFNRDILVEHLNNPPTDKEMEQYAENAKKAEEAKAALAKAKAEAQAAKEKAEKEADAAQELTKKEEEK